MDMDGDHLVKGRSPDWGQTMGQQQLTLAWDSRGSSGAPVSFQGGLEEYYDCTGSSWLGSGGIGGLCRDVEEALGILGQLTGCPSLSGEACFLGDSAVKGGGAGMIQGFCGASGCLRIPEDTQGSGGVSGVPGRFGGREDPQGFKGAGDPIVTFSTLSFAGARKPQEK